MNDRFKFRVWEKDQKIMKECTQITLDKEQTGSMCDVKGKVTAHLIYQPHYILMQCTGLKDKNGTLIYEGDIVRTKQTNPLQARIGVIQWHSGYFAIDFFELGKYGEAGMSITKDTQNYMTIEVIGNIYENKELLDERN